MWLVSVYSVLLAFLRAASSFTPYQPTAGWTYYVEAVREQAWPSCQYRFMSYPSTCDKVDLWNAAGINQEWTLEDAGGGNFYLLTSCGHYLSYPGDCTAHVIDTWPQAGVNQAFKFVVGDNTQFEYYLQAVGRKACPFQWASFPVPCTTSAPDTVDLWDATGPDQRFRLHPVRSASPPNHKVNSQCTGGALDLMAASTLNPDVLFEYEGNCLGGTPPPWALSDNSRAMESTALVGSPPRRGPNPKRGTSTRPTTWNLGNAPGGDIDPHVFRDTDGRTYLAWKTDDNNVGATVTRLWAQEISMAKGSVTQLGSPQQIMDSTGLWWIDSWVPGGSLVEGPEIVKMNGFYYLFFAAGQYCQDSYSEGVARSPSIWGPYEKMGIPLLSTGLVGTADGAKLVGPGHASFVLNATAQQWYAVWYAVWHASMGENCNRYAFVSNLEFGADGWPYVNF
ncbi:hypothetical protein EMCRGX_G024802 [Ephydatia muelleri]